MSLIGYVDDIYDVQFGKESRPCIHGWAWDSSEPERRPVLEVIVDDNVIGLTIGDRYRRDLESGGFGNGQYGFRYPLPREYADGQNHTIRAKFRGADTFLTNSRAFNIPPRQSSVALCAIVKNEEKYLVEWIAHHKSLGVDHFFVYDNESNDDTPLILAELEAAAIVTRIPWPSNGLDNPQVAAYEDSLKYIAGKFSWVGFLDLDEFFNPAEGEGIQDVLDLHKGADAVAFNWRVFGSSGLLTHENKPVTQRFTWRSREDFEANKFFKTFARPESIVEVLVHQVRLARGIYVSSGGAWLDPRGLVGKTQIPDYTTACINHYFSKSREEWNIKKRRGMADKPLDSENRIRQDSAFTIHDNNDIHDETVKRFSSRLQLEMLKIQEFGEFCFKHCYA